MTPDIARLIELAEAAKESDRNLRVAIVDRVTSVTVESYDFSPGCILRLAQQAQTPQPNEREELIEIICAWRARCRSYSADSDRSVEGTYKLADAILAAERRKG